MYISNIAKMKNNSSTGKMIQESKCRPLQPHHLEPVHLPQLAVAIVNCEWKVITVSIQSSLLKTTFMKQYFIYYIYYIMFV